jgi:hypothetical protein
VLWYVVRFSHLNPAAAGWLGQLRLAIHVYALLLPLFFARLASAMQPSCLCNNMKPFYSIDAGEFLVGSAIEKRYPSVSLWFPAKDTGDDFLLLNRNQGAQCAIQVKVSRDYLATHMAEALHPHLKCCGWFTPRRSKIMNSKSDFWILGLHSYGKLCLRLLILRPEDLLRRYDRIHGQAEQLQSYFWLTADERVYETRGLSKRDQSKILDGTYRDKDRDFTSLLENWLPLETKLKINT